MATALWWSFDWCFFVAVGHKWQMLNTLRTLGFQECLAISQFFEPCPTRNDFKTLRRIAATRISLCTCRETLWCGTESQPTNEPYSKRLTIRRSIYHLLAMVMAMQNVWGFSIEISYTIMGDGDGMPTSTWTIQYWYKYWMSRMIGFSTSDRQTSIDLQLECK